MVKMMSATELPRERSEMGWVKPCRIGPAAVKPARCSKDL